MFGICVVLETAVVAIVSWVTVVFVAKYIGIASHR